MKIIAAAIVLVCLALSGAASAQEAGAGWLGVELQDVTKEEADSLGWEAPRGAKVVKPQPSSPAEAAGLQPGDVLVTLDGVEIENVKAFIEAVSKKAAGTDIRLAISRAGREKRLAVKLAARPAQFAAKPKAAEDAPIPMLDTGGHMAKIQDIAFTPDGRQLVSASNDKVIRVWDVATGKTVRTLHGEAAAGNAGKIFAMALSPDGKWLAVGGWFAPGHGVKDEEVGAIRLYDFASGRLVARLLGHENAVVALAFSPDGRHLLSGSGGGDFTAIIWDIAPNASFVGRDQSDALRSRSANIAPVIAAPFHRLRGHTDEIYAVGFAPDGARAVTGSLDHDLRLWSVESGESLQTMTGHKDKVRSLAVAPDGTIASGDVSGEIRLWNGKTGASLKVLARQKTSVGSLSFSPDGTRLLSGVGSHPLECHVYDTASGREIVTYRGHDNIVLATAISPDGRWAATGGGDNQEIHIWDPHTAERRKGPDGQPLTLSGRGQPVWAVGFSADGRRIGWGNLGEQTSPVNRGPLQHALTLPTGDAPLTGPVSIGEGAFLRAVAEQNGWSLRHRKGGNRGLDAILDIIQDGRQVAAIERGPTDGYDHRAYTFTPDGQTIISGGMNGKLFAYDRAGNNLGDFIGHEGDIWAVAASPDGRFLVSGADDQTLRLWNLQTRELLVTLYRGTDGEWVMWTPQGYYVSSPAGAELIGWQINKGPENAADYVTGAQLRRHLHRPDVVARTIQLASEADALREFNVRGFKLEDLIASPVPRFSISSPAEGATVRNGAAEIQLALEPAPDPIKQINIRVNGRQIAAVNPGNGGAFEPGTLTVSADLAQGRNEVNITTVNDIGEQTHTLTLNHEGQGYLDKRGTLYILAVGVDEYPGLKGTCAGLPGAAGSCDLRFAGADASAFADMAARRMLPLYERTVRRVLTNGKGADQPPTRTNIVDALGMLQQAQPNDTVVVFLAGHGKSDGLNYRFLPTDSVAEGTQIRQSSVVSWFEIKEALEGARGRRILFLDTCHAGNAYNQRLDSDVYNADIVTYAAAQGDQRAQEDAASGHGLFTAAVVDGIDGAADGDKDKRVLTNELGGFVKERVRSLATALGHRQEPRMYRGKDAGDYLLSRSE